MNKEEFVTFIAAENQCTKADAARALNMVKDAVIAGLAKGQKITLVGFGTFYVQSRAARDGRNPKTGKPMKIAAYNQPAFKSGKQLKTACN